MAVKLTRAAPGVYRATAQVRGTTFPAELTITNNGVGWGEMTWTVEGDDERFFKTKKDAVAYINRFFEPLGKDD